MCFVVFLWMGNDTVGIVQCLSPVFHVLPPPPPHTHLFFFKINPYEMDTGESISALLRLC